MRTSPASAGRSASSSSTPCFRASRRARSRRCSLTSSATSSVITCGSASRGSSSAASLLATLGYLIDQPWFYEALGVTQRSTAVALILFFMVVPVFTFLLLPIGSFYSRRHEYEADAYAARHSSGEDLVHALVKLYQDNATTLTPDPVHSAFYDSHPPAALRIARLHALARGEVAQGA